MYKTNKGFTIFEIMVVVAIIALLMLIALPNYVEARNKSRENICISNQKMIYTAATMYIIKETTSLKDISGDGARLQELIDKGYLRGRKWAECPSSSDKDYDDYIMIFEDSFIADIECDENPQHIWP